MDQRIEIFKSVIDALGNVIGDTDARIESREVVFAGWFMNQLLGQSELDEEITSEQHAELMAAFDKTINERATKPLVFIVRVVETGNTIGVFSSIEKIEAFITSSTDSSIDIEHASKRPAWSVTLTDGTMETWLSEPVYINEPGVLDGAV